MDVRIEGWMWMWTDFLCNWILFNNTKKSKVLGNEVKVGVLASSSAEAFFHNTRDNVLKQSYENNIRNNLMPTLEAAIKAIKNG